MILVERFIKQKPIKSFDPKAFNIPNYLKLRIHSFLHSKS